MNLVWADLRKLRPCRGLQDAMRRNGPDEHKAELSNSDIQLGIDRKNIFSIWPEFSGLEQDLDSISEQWDEMREICRRRFDSTRYACEILKRTILWDMNSQYRHRGGTKGQERLDGSTGITNINSGANPPFRINIVLSADYIWPLLVDTYSPAEKASASTLIAATMLHELAVSLPPSLPLSPFPSYPWRSVK